MTPTTPLARRLYRDPAGTFADLAHSYRACPEGGETPKAYVCDTETFDTLFQAPPGVLTISTAPTYSCGWVDDDGIWHHQIRRSADDAILFYIRRGQVIYDAAEACP